MKNALSSLILAALSVPAVASTTIDMDFTCDHSKPARISARDLAGVWDLVMDVGALPRIGVLALGRVADGLSGSISLSAGVVVVGKVSVKDDAVMMLVTTAEGDVRFDGALTSDAQRMCGIVTYHGGTKIPMVAQKRATPTTPPSGA